MSAWPQRPLPPPPTPRPGLSLLLPGAGRPPGRLHPHGPPRESCGGGGGIRPLALSPTEQPCSPHRLPQAEPPQLLQAGFQPLLQGPLLLPHGVGQLLRGGHRAVGACWGQGPVLRTAGPGCLPASSSPAGDAQAGSQSHTCPDCGPATTVPCYSRKPACLPPPDGPGPLGGRAALPALCGRRWSGFTPSHPTLHPRPLTAFSASSPLSLTRTHTHHPHLFSLVLCPNQSPLGPPACMDQSLSPSPQPDKIFQLLRDGGAKGERFRYLPRQDPRSRPDPQQGKPSSPPGVCPATLRAQSPGLMDSGDGGVEGSGTWGLGGLSHSPDCRMMPLSVSLTSSLLSMVGFWEEGARRRRGRQPSQPRPGHRGGLEFPQLLKEQQKMTEVKLRASRQSGLVQCMRAGLRSGDLASGGGSLGVGRPQCWVTRPWVDTQPSLDSHRCPPEKPRSPGGNRRADPGGPRHQGGKNGEGKSGRGVSVPGGAPCPLPRGEDAGMRPGPCVRPQPRAPALSAPGSPSEGRCPKPPTSPGLPTTPGRPLGGEETRASRPQPGETCCAHVCVCVSLCVCVCVWVCVLCVCVCVWVCGCLCVSMCLGM